MAQQESIGQSMTASVDPRGDASMQIEFTLSAKAWLNWKSQYGDHPDLLRRDLTHQFSMYELVDFKLERDDINRKATASMKIRGEARYRGDGKFEIILPKAWNKVTDTGREWHFSYSQIIGQGLVLNQTFRIILPEGVQDARLGPGLTGQQILGYRLPLKEGANIWPALFFAGLAGLGITIALRFTIWKQPHQAGQALTP
jgi:hypothetical protein